VDFTSTPRTKAYPRGTPERKKSRGIALSGYTYSGFAVAGTMAEPRSPNGACPLRRIGTTRSYKTGWSLRIATRVQAYARSSDSAGKTRIG
jgi:hypothetical protein